MKKRLLCCAFFLTSVSFAQSPKTCQQCRGKSKEVIRSDQLPAQILESDSDCFHTGYVQALLDMHFLDSQCQVVVNSGVAHLFSLPTDPASAEAIVQFVQDLPFISSVEICEASYVTYHKDSLRLERPKLPKRRTIGSKILFGKEGVWLPQNTLLFSPLIADPRQVTNSAGIRFDDEAIGNCVGSAIFGGDFIFLRLFDLTCLHGDLDIGLQGGVFSVFDLRNPEACMVNSDFFVSALLGFAFDRWSFRFRLWHLSSHIGDEFLISNKDFNRFNLSDEGIDCFAAWRFSSQIRFYGGLGYIVSRDLSFPEKPFYAETGVELRPFGLREDNIHAQPVLAMHFRFWEEQNFDVDQTYILGMEWSKFRDIGKKFRAFAEYHQGFSKEGQFVREKTSYYGVRVSYGF